MTEFTFLFSDLNDLSFNKPDNLFKYEYYY